MCESVKRLWKNWFIKIKRFLIGGLILAILLLLMSCACNVNLAPLPNIDCMKDLSTPEKMAFCLIEYDEAYASIKKVIDNQK